MYKIYADKDLIYDSTLDDYVITKGQIELEVNKSGSFTFAINQNHPYYDRIQKLKTIITVFKDDYLVFRSRVLTFSDNYFKTRTFVCEGELSFLIDSIQRPYVFQGTPSELFTQYITKHNEQVEDVKKFEIGNVTVKDDNDYINRSNSAYESTLENLNKRLVENLGGYIHVTHANDKSTINYLDDFPYLSKQSIEFGENLLDFIKTDSGEDIATAIIPLGAKIETPAEAMAEGDEGGTSEEKRLTIESVNGGVDFLYNELAVQKYGWIFKVETWDDVTEPENLKRKGENLLNSWINSNISLEVNAIDMSSMDLSIDNFKLGDYINIKSEPHNLNDRMLLKKQSLNLLKPDDDKISLGYTYKTFIDESLENNNKNDGLIDRIETIEKDYVVNEIVTSQVEALKSLITQTSQSIMFEVSQTYATNDQVVSEISTKFTQLHDSFEFMFKELEKTVGDNANEYRDEFTEIHKYIRFIDGNIVLGRSDSTIVLKIENDTIAFYENNNQVAYFKNRMLYVTDAEFIKSIRVGKFAFIPRSNGNLQFKKVVK